MGERAAPCAACTAGACFVGEADGHSLPASLQSNGRELKLCPRIKAPHTGSCATSSCLPCSPAGSSHLGLCRCAVQRGKHTPYLHKTTTSGGEPRLLGQDGNAPCISLLCVSAPCWCLVLPMTMFARTVPNSNEAWVHYFLPHAKCLFRIPVN